jgi:hypothetical protein
VRKFCRVFCTSLLKILSFFKRTSLFALKILFVFSLERRQSESKLQQRSGKLSTDFLLEFPKRVLIILWILNFPDNTRQEK